MAITKVSPGLLDLDSGITITTADNSDNLTLTSTDADANVAPNLRMYRNSSSPADSDQLGKIQFEGKNDKSGDNQDVIYGEIGSQIKDASDGTEDGRVFINTMVAGSLQSRMNILANEVVFNEESNDQDFRIEGNGQANLFVVDGGTDNIGIGIASPTFATGNGMHFADSFYVGLGTGNGTRPDFSLSGNNSGLAIACGTGSDDADILISTAGVMAVPNGIELGSGTDFTAANTLDDYEEGSFTPTLSFGGGTTGIGYSFQEGRYIKIGKLVHIQILIALSSKGSSTGDAKLTVPFAVDNLSGSTQWEAPASFFLLVGNSNLGNSIPVFSDTQGGIIWADTQVSSTEATNSIFTDTTNFRITGQYQTSA